MDLNYSTEEEAFRSEVRTSTDRAATGNDPPRAAGDVAICDETEAPGTSRDGHAIRSARGPRAMTVARWLAAAQADVERRGLPELKPLLQALAAASTALRRAEWNERADRPATPPGTSVSFSASMVTSAPPTTMGISLSRTRTI